MHDLGVFSDFLIADGVTIESKSLLTGEQTKLESAGEDCFQVTPIQEPMEDPGTIVTLHLKEDYQSYLETEKLVNTLNNYCGGIKCPVSMYV